MGLLSSITKAVKSTATKAVSTVANVAKAVVSSPTTAKVVTTVTKPAVIVAAAVTHPISYVKEPVKTVEKFVSQPLGVQVIEGAAAGALLGSAAAGTLASAAGTAGKAVLSTVTKTTAGKIGAIVGVPLAAGVAVTSPTSIKTAANILNPVANLERGGLIGTSIEKASDKTKEFWAQVGVKEALFGTGAAVLTAGTLGYSYLTKDEVNIVNKKAKEKGFLGEGEELNEQGQLIEDEAKVSAQPVGVEQKGDTTGSITPVTAATTSVTTKKRKRKVKKVATLMRQNVNIKINNRSGVKFINSRNY